MRPTARFRNLLAAPEILVMPGVHDALSAKIAEAEGFQALTMGGFAATGVLLGEPDTAQLTAIELADHYARVCDAVSLPVFADADTGFGNVTNVARTVRLYERAGVAGLFIEDQVFPKRCGHMPGKGVIGLEEMLGKLKAALDARVDADLVIMARTDALVVEGLEPALERAQRFREAGADLIFVESPRSEDEMRRIVAEVGGLQLANMVEGGLTPPMTAGRLEALGFAAAVWPVAGVFAVAWALKQFYAGLKRDGGTAGLQDRMLSFREFTDLVGLPELRESEQRYLDAAAQLMARRGSS
ncbi:MAG: oxaloacetate decarboxylase [Tistlia sp.]|uniref:oxaloacetate decarboxylase n=1 Tax=Tistlia sp. TaxID=3057121 RepID=UPI0034A10A50